jgi:hypothetical protein
MDLAFIAPGNLENKSDLLFASVGEKDIHMASPCESADRTGEAGQIYRWLK